MVYIDSSKAFDSVCHSKLIIKLHTVGIRGKVLAWISSYLSNRVQIVQIGKTLTSQSCISVVECHRVAF
jgi:hypothetical protein